MQADAGEFGMAFTDGIRAKLTAAQFRPADGLIPSTLPMSGSSI
jgi:hypothetical protein